MQERVGADLGDPVVDPVDVAAIRPAATCAPAARTPRRRGRTGPGAPGRRGTGCRPRRCGPSRGWPPSRRRTTASWPRPGVAQRVDEEQPVLGGDVAGAEHRSGAAGPVDVRDAVLVADDGHVVARAVGALHVAGLDPEGRVLVVARQLAAPAGPASRRRGPRTSAAGRSRAAGAGRWRGRRRSRAAFTLWPWPGGRMLQEAARVVGAVGARRRGGGGRAGQRQRAPDGQRSRRPASALPPPRIGGDCTPRLGVDAPVARLVYPSRVSAARSRS